MAECVDPVPGTGQEVLATDDTSRGRDRIPGFVKFNTVEDAALFSATGAGAGCTSAGVSTAATVLVPGGMTVTGFTQA